MATPNTKRIESLDSTDFYPTPPYVTRALFTYVLPTFDKNSVVHECAAGHLDMSNVLEKHAKTVISTDIQHDGVSYLDRPAIACDWVITNPPYNLAFEFVQKALSEAKVGVAMFLRATFLEGNKRYKELYKDNPPSTVGIFTRRVGLKKNVVDVKAGSAVMYAWIVWEKEKKGLTSNLIFIPPCNLD